MSSTPGLSQLAPAKVGVRRIRFGNGVIAQLVDARAGAGLRLLIDVVVLYLGSCVALFADSSLQADWLSRILVVAFPPLVLGIMGVRHRAGGHLSDSLLDAVAQVLGGVSLAAMLTVAAESVFSAPHPLTLALRLWLFAVVYLGIERSVLISLRRYAIRTGMLATPTLIVGAGVIGSHLVMRLASEPSYGLRPVGFVDADPMPSGENGAGHPAVPVLGGPDDLLAAVASTGARRVILAFSAEPDRVLVAKVRECQALGVEVSLVPRLFETVNEQAVLSHVGGIPLLTLKPIDPRGWAFAIKHAIDRGLAAFGLLLMSPLMAVIAVLVVLSSPGPVFFRQRRVGRDGHEFDLLKFRTMREASDSPGEFELDAGCAPGGVEGVDRRTWVGRLLREVSLDELPQLFNVVRGDMSLVGPRPERPEYVERFVREVARYGDRHRVKSGITGWAQVHGLRGQTSIDDRVEWDNYYIQNWSLRLDLRIIVLTVAEMLRLRG